MPISSETSGGVCTIKVAGRFDFSCRAEFKNCYKDVPGGTSFIVDFDAVEYVDSSALGMLLLLRDAAGKQGTVTIVNSRGQPDQVLRIANFHRIFSFN